MHISLKSTDMGVMATIHRHQLNISRNINFAVNLKGQTTGSRGITKAGQKVSRQTLGGSRATYPGVHQTEAH